MKRIISFLLCAVCMFSFFGIEANAADRTEFVPYVIDFSVTTEINTEFATDTESRASGLINAYALSISRQSNSSVLIEGITSCSSAIVKSGFKNLTVQRRASSSDSWEDYYEYGNVYRDSNVAGLSTTLAVESGYYYRVTCKHYAKKNIFSVETISNISEDVYV